MGRTHRRVASFLVAVTVSLALFPGEAVAALTNHRRALLAASFVVARQRANGSIPGFSPIGSTADAVLDLVAVGAGAAPAQDAIAFLRRQTRKGNVDTLGLQAKVALAVEADGLNASTFAGTDLLGQITETERLSGRFGNATVFGQALAILAVRSAGVSPDAKAVAWLVDAQCPDGGWQFDRPHRSSENRHCHDAANARDAFASDTNTTAYVVMAIAGLQSPGLNPFGFFARIRDDARGGWGYTWGFRGTDANSTALVIQAYAADAIALPAGAMHALQALQYPCGAVAFTWSGTKRTGPDVGATIGAVLGYLQEPLPVSAGVTATLPPPPVCG